MTNHLPNDDLQLDAWLESQSGGSVPSPNGTATHSPDALVSIARHYHAALHTAEQRAVPEIPAQRMWEDVMRATAPLGTVAIPAAGHNGTMPPPNRPTADDAHAPWAKPGHWLAPTLLCAAVLIGILAVYATFLNDDAAPPPTTAPGLAFGSPDTDPATPATPDTSIDEWLARPDDIACPPAAAGATPIPLGSYPDDLPMPVENYLPLNAADAASQRVIAERFLTLNLGCPATETDPVMSSDFSWMPGPSITPATADQIETAQQVSAALPSQDYLDYYIVRPATETSSSDGQYVLLPEDVVQLPDGRLGAPMRMLVLSDNPDSAIDAISQGRDMAATAFVVFEQADGQWLYDELFMLCVGDCDAYWAMVAGELPVPVTCDVTPLTLDDISRIEQSETEFGNARQYGPVTPVDAPLNEDISTAYDRYAACQIRGDWRDMASNRLIQEAATTGSAVNGTQEGEPRLRMVDADDEAFAFQQDLSAIFLPGPLEDYSVATDDARGKANLRRLEPEDVVSLPDGRIGGPITNYYETSFEPNPYPFQTVEIVIFSDSRTERGWVVDQNFYLCVGECEGYYDYLRTGLYPTPPALQATPAANADTDQWLVDPSASSCPKNDVDPFPPDIAFTAPGPAEDYLPFGEQPQESLRMQVASSYQRLQGNCAPLSPEDTLVNPDLAIFQVPSTGPDATPVTRQQVDTAMAIASALDTGDPLDWIIEGPALPPDASEGGSMASHRYVILPESVVQLPDGRVAAPGHIYLQTNDPDGAAGWFGDRPYIDVLFYVFDPTVPGMPVDEVITLCLGDCDSYWASYIIANVEGTPVATPVATPASTPSNAAPITRRRTRAGRRRTATRLPASSTPSRTRILDERTSRPALFR